MCSFTEAAAASMVLALAASSALASPANPEGRWLSGNGNVVVQIAPCGPALCGTIVKVLANRAMDGGAAPVGPQAGAGTKIMTNLRADGPGRWVGRLYNRQNGQTYDCVLSDIGDAQMTVRAYVLLPLIGKAQVWRRAP